MEKEHKSNNKINWFPGHMHASLRNYGEHLKKCDIILYVLDARCPRSCLNPKFEELVNRKPVIFVLNKADLAPYPDALKQFAAFNNKHNVVALDSTKTNSSKKLVPAIKRVLPNKTRIHALVIGVPNCGKSTLINNLAGSGKTKTADKPGVTRIPQWVIADTDGLFLLDTPGVLWPNLDDQLIAKNLAYIGSIKDDILDIIELARELLVDIKYPDTFEAFCRKRGFLQKGGIIDEQRGARAVLIDFRAGKFGKFNLDLLLEM